MLAIARSALRIALVGVASASAFAAAPTFELDKVHSNVVFKVGHMGVANMFGMIHGAEGTYSINASDPSASSIKIKLLAENIDTGNEARDKHLKSPDFFDAKQFPEITFVGTAFEKVSDKAFKVTGDLTMLGKTKPVTATLMMVGEGETKQGYKAGMETTFTIKRSDFGMTKYTEGNAIGDEITVMVAIEGKRQ